MDFSTVSSYILGISAYNEVYTACQDCAHNWEDIGCFLGVKRISIEIIKENNRNNSKACLRDVITTWLKKDSTSSIRYPIPSWRLLCKAVESTGDRALANKIGKEHPNMKPPVAENTTFEERIFECICGKCTVESSKLHPCPNIHTPRRISMPNLPSSAHKIHTQIPQDEFMEERTKKTEKLRKSFQSCFFSTIKALEDCEVSAKEVWKFICIHMADKHTKDLAFSAADSYIEIVHFLKHRLTWFDFELLEEIATHFLPHIIEIQRRWIKYRQDLQLYTSEGVTEIEGNIIAVTLDYENEGLNIHDDLPRLRQTLAKALGFPRNKVQFITVLDNPDQIIFRSPKINQPTCDGLDALAAVGISHIDSQDKHVEVSSYHENITTCFGQNEVLRAKLHFQNKQDRLTEQLQDNQWSVGNIMDSNDIGKKDQYQKRLSDRLIEGRRENQIMEMRLPLPDSSSTSRVSDNSREKDRQIVQLTHQLRESEESRQEVSQRLEHVRREIQQERNHQQRDIQEKDRQLRLRNDEIRQLRESDNRQRETILRLQQNSQDFQQANEALRDTNEQLQQENRILRSNIETPHWVIRREELQMTQQEIGGGAYGKVKIAIFRGTRVAAKSLHEVIISEYNLGVFIREMEISSRIHHPNIVQFLGATRVNNPILLYELMTTSLYKKIQEARLTQPQILDVSSDITSALAYLHLWKPHPIIHRDVSSPNVLMEPSGNDRWRSKLSDFGSANLQSRVKTEIPGNPAYASPEARIPDNHTPAMDIYSLGVVILEMILHQPPEITTISREQQAQRIQWRPMKVLVLRCINNDRTQRPKTVQVLDVLKQIG